MESVIIQVQFVPRRGGGRTGVCVCCLFLCLFVATETIKRRMVGYLMSIEWKDFRKEFFF